MNKLNFFGVGPKMARVFLPWLASSIFLSCINIAYFKFVPERSDIIFYGGLILLFGGLILYFSTVKMLLNGLKETKLMTKGPYRLCQNPLYSTIILLIVPAISLLLNSWLILTTCVAGYIVFKVNIISEYQELEKFFGEEYLKYKKETPEFFPLPFKKWTK